MLPLVLAMIIYSSSVSANDYTISCVEGTTDSELALEVIQTAYKRLGHNAIPKWMGAKEAIESSSSGVTDAELLRIDDISLKFPSLIQIPIPINFMEVGVVHRKDFKLEVTNWHSLRPYKIGIVKGLYVAERGTRGMPYITRGEGTSGTFDLLKSGQVDVVALPLLEGEKFVRMKGNGEFMVNPQSLQSYFLYHYLHQKNKALKLPLENVLRDMLLTGETREIRAKYINQLLNKRP